MRTRRTWPAHVLESPQVAQEQKTKKKENKMKKDTPLKKQNKEKKEKPEKKEKRKYSWHTLTETQRNDRARAAHRRAMRVNAFAIAHAIPRC